MELYEHHPVAGVGVSDHDVAQEPFLSSDVEKSDVVLTSIVENLVPDEVLQVVHEMALPNGQDFVESAVDVEADGIHVVKRLACLNLFAGEPSFVGAAEFQLVAVFINFHRTENRPDFRQVDLSDAHELVFHLLLFGLKLLLIR